MTVASEIKDAVEVARDAGAKVFDSYADEAIRAGKTVDKVKSELFESMVTAKARAMSRASMLKAAGIAEPATSSTQRQADRVAALPSSIAEAKGDVRAFGKADIMRQAAAQTGAKPASAGRANMEEQIRKMGLQPKGSSHG